MSTRKSSIAIPGLEEPAKPIVYKAKECARKIDYLYGKAVEISGNEITMVM